MKTGTPPQRGLTHLTSVPLLLLWQAKNQVNEVFSSYFNEGRRPSRTTVGVIGLAAQGNVEIDLIVYCGS